MTTIERLLAELRQLNVTLWVDGDRLHYRAAKGTMTLELLTQLQCHKLEILALLREAYPVSPSDLQPSCSIAAHPERAIALSCAQQQYWVLEQFAPGQSIYNLPLAYRMTGLLNLAVLKQCLVEIVRRHAILRTTYKIVEGKPSQWIAPDIPLRLPIIDLRKAERRETEAQTLAAAEAKQPFDLERGPVFRFKLLCLAEDEHVLVLTLHHIAADGWSSEVFFQELTALYEALAAGKPSPLPALPIQYADFALWQRQWLQGDVLKTQLDYWKQRLSGNLPVLQLPTDHLRLTKSAPARSPFHTYAGTVQRQMLSETLVDALKSLSYQSGTTLAMLLLAAFKVLLSRYSGQDDIIVGSPIAGRNHIETEGLMGLFVNTLALRTDLSGNPTLRELLGRVRETCLEAYTHQDIPFDKLIEALQPDRSSGYPPIFQVMFAMNPPWTQGATREISGMTLSSTFGYVHTGTSKYDLTLVMRETGQGLRMSFEYKTDLFDDATITRMLGHFQTLLEGIVANPDQRLSDLPLLTAVEHHQLLVEWNNTRIDYPRQTSIPHLFEAQAEQTPNAVALVFADQALTYRELNHRANQLAHYLQELGVGSETLVGLCLERSLDLIVSLLAILKAGGAYVPLDPAYPHQRLACILEETRISVLLTQQNLLEAIPPTQAQVVCLDRDRTAIGQARIENLAVNVSADHLAYVMYTSGSTGKPKGVSVIHRGVVRLVKATNYAVLTRDDIFLQLAPISFDASTFEIWGALLNGAKLVVMPPDLPSLSELGQAIQHHQITTLWLTASLFHLMVDEQIAALTSVRQLLAGGEVLSLAHVQKFLAQPNAGKLINGYGPTENTTFTCCHLITELTAASIPIGRPVANTQVYVLDSHQQLVPIGVPGELYIGGDGLARDYFNHPALTAAAFIRNPFSPDSNSRLYRTGDQVRYLPDGTLEFLGRLDDQVKIRGFRIEPREIEIELSQHPAVRNSVVVVRENQPGNKQLVAYLVPQDQQTTTIDELRFFLTNRLPDYMMPSAFLVLDSLPLTPNGKLDHGALPPAASQRQSQQPAAQPGREELEIQLTKIWEQILDVRPIGLREPFFALGGNSLLAVRLFAIIEERFGKKLPLTTLFQAATIEQLAHILRQAGWVPSWSSLVPLQPTGAKPAFYCVHPHGGNVLCYRDLIHHLDTDQPFYGLQAQGLDGQRPPYESIEEMAAHYIREIQTIQPTGPYFLGGFCAGGLIAFEMAQQLQRQNQEVALLAIIDAALDLDPTFQFSGKTPRFYYRNLTGYWERGGIPRVLDAIATKMRHTLAVLTDSEMRDYDRMWQFHMKAVTRYQPRPYAGKVTLIQSSEWDLHHPNFVLRWTELATMGLDYQVIEGKHIHLLSAYRVQTLAHTIQHCLSKAQVHQDTLLVPDQSSGLVPRYHSVRAGTVHQAIA
jgi:aspartate racemase